MGPASRCRAAGRSLPWRDGAEGRRPGGVDRRNRLSHPVYKTKWSGQARAPTPLLQNELCGGRHGFFPGEHGLA
jgi:hypothetical protein